MKNMKIASVLMLGILTVLMLPVAALASAEFDITMTQSTFEVGWSESKTVNINIVCTNSAQSCNCKSRVDGGSWSGEFTVNPGTSSARNVIVTAPSSGEGSQTRSYEVGCNE